MTKKSKIISAIVLIFIILAGFGAFYGYRYYVEKSPNVTRETIIKVYSHYNYQQFLDTLKASGAIKRWNTFEKLAQKRGLENYIKSGRYILKEEMGNQYIIRMVANGWQTPIKMTFKGYTRRTHNLAYAFSRWFEADSVAFSQVLQDRELIDSLGFSEETFIGMFIPNTYEFYWTASPKDVVLRFKKEYDRFWNNERLSKAKSMNFTPMEAITLASIVAEETNTPGEWPKIAGVYMNRLRKGMPLQACPTVKYVVIEDEPDLTRILNRHLKVDSPYNTYKNRGLPPGPITVAPPAVVDAVLNYEKTNYLYFCAKPEFDGTHNFSTSYSQHAKYSKLYNAAYKEWKKKKG